MPRQPLLPVFKNAGIELGPGFLDFRPDIAAAIAKCIALWSDIEFQHAMVLAALLRTDAGPSVSVFLSLRNARSQREIILAAGDEILSEQERKLLSAIMRASEALEKQRSDLAHGLYGKSDDIPDGVLWIHNRDRASHAIKMSRAISPDDDDVKFGTFAKIAVELKECIFVYRISDIYRLAAELEAHHSIVYRFSGLARLKTGQPRNELCIRLGEEPSVRCFIGAT